MASLEQITETRTVVTGYSLTLSEQEAQALVDVLSKIGGDPYCSSRKHTQAVLDALMGEGFYWRKSVFTKPDGEVGLYFKNEVDI